MIGRRFIHIWIHGFENELVPETVVELLMLGEEPDSVPPVLKQLNVELDDKLLDVWVYHRLQDEGEPVPVLPDVFDASKFTAYSLAWEEFYMVYKQIIACK